MPASTSSSPTARLTDETLTDLMPDLTSTVVTALRPKDRQRCGELSERFERYAEQTATRRTTSAHARAEPDGHDTQELAPGDDLFDDRVLAASDDVPTRRIRLRR
jgi:hypothetical protein